MRLNQTEQEGFDYIVNNLFTPVVTECDIEIQSLLNQDQELKMKVEEKLKRIMINRALKKASEAEMFKLNEGWNDFNNQVIVNNNGQHRGKLIAEEYNFKLTPYNTSLEIIEQRQDYSETKMSGIDVRVSSSHIQLAI